MERKRTFSECFCQGCFIVLNTKIYFQTAHRRSAGQGEARQVWVPRCLGDWTHPQQRQERRTLAQWLSQSFRQARRLCSPRPALGRVRGGCGPQRALRVAAARTQLGAQQRRTLATQPNLPEPALRKTTSFGRHLVAQVSPRDFPLLSKKSKNKNKEKNTHLGRRCLHTPESRTRALLPSLNPLREVLGEDALALVQLLVLVPVALLHAHEPAFVLREQSAG